MAIDSEVLKRLLEEIEQLSSQYAETNHRDATPYVLVSRLAHCVLQLLPEVTPPDKPTFDHYRNDSRFTPCPVCLEKMSRTQLLELIHDMALLQHD